MLTINNLCIIGTGLIGGSFALALKKSGICRSIVGAGRTEATLQKAKQLNIIDSYQTDISKAVQTADIVFISVPLGAYQHVFEKIAKGLKNNKNSQVVITDAGSSKVKVQQLAEQILKDKASHFVAGHPLAGTEHSGPKAAFADLYQKHRVILTPTAQTDIDAIELVTHLWKKIGADVGIMTTEKHDEILAATSHLPHILAFNLVYSLQKLDKGDDILKLSAGGFKDFTRIASGDPVMWRDICLHNKQPILEILSHYLSELSHVKQAIEAEDGDKLLDIFQQAKQTRDKIFNSSS